MGYATVMNVPTVYEYAMAKHIHDNSKPIRGRSPEVRPLGARRDVDCYQVRMNGDDVEFVLYSTPVITYKPNGDVVLFTNGYNTVSTHQFMEKVLNINANSSRRVSVITLGKDVRYTLNGQNRLTLRRDGGNWSCVAGAQTQFSWQLNRQEATKVRLRYKEFIEYFKAVVSLRTVGFTSRYTDYERMGIRLSLAEMCEAFEVQANTMSAVLDMFSLNGLNVTNNMSKYGLSYRANEIKKAEQMFLTFVRGDQNEDDKHRNFYRAGLAFMYAGDSLFYNNDEKEMVVNATNICKRLDTFLLRVHAKEVLVKKELRMGSVSSGTYEGWITEE